MFPSYTNWEGICKENYGDVVIFYPKYSKMFHEWGIFIWNWENLEGAYCYTWCYQWRKKNVMTVCFFNELKKGSFRLTYHISIFYIILFLVYSYLHLPIVFLNAYAPIQRNLCNCWKTRLVWVLLDWLSRFDAEMQIL